MTYLASVFFGAAFLNLMMALVGLLAFAWTSNLQWEKWVMRGIAGMLTGGVIGVAILILGNILK